MLRLTETLGSPGTPDLRPAAAADAAAPPPPPGSRGSGFEELVIELDLNDQKINRSLFVLRAPDGTILLRQEDLASFRLKTPSVAPVEYEGRPYFSLYSLPGAQATFDEARQRLVVKAAPEAFVASEETLARGKAYAPAVAPSPGGFLNYTVSALHSDSESLASGVVETGIFNRYGVLLNTAVVNPSPDRRDVIRLDSTFNSDFPSRHTTFRAGDAIIRPGSWGQAIRFGGLQYQTNFTTDPGYLTFPPLAISGQAVVPSLVDVYVNNALVATREVKPGPFSINNIAFANGAGNVRLVVRDMLNRESVVTVMQPFYSTNTLLKAGLSEYSAEVGQIREDYGIASNHYGEGFATGTFRRGLTDRFTAEARGELSREQQAVGLAGTFLVRTIGVFDAKIAASHSTDGSGQLAGMAWQRMGDIFSLGAQLEWYSKGFRGLGFNAEQLPPRFQAVAGIGVQLRTFGSLSISGATQDFRDRPRIDVVSLGYSIPVGSRASLNINAARSMGEESGSSLMATLTMPLGPNMNASLSQEATRSQGASSNGTVATLQRNRVGDDVYGYRLAARNGQVDGSFDYRTNINDYRLDVERTASSTAGRLQVSGGVGYVAGHAFLSRNITGSFGVVEVADYPGVGILFENQFVGRTDSKGVFVIPEMRAYDRNQIAIRETDLPMDAVIQQLKVDAAPYFRSGVLVTFPVRHLRAGVLYVRLDDGSFLPSGALVKIEGEEEEFPAALKGEVYVAGFTGKDRLLVKWREQSCTIEVDYPQTSDPLPDLGTYLCKGVKP